MATRLHNWHKWLLGIIAALIGLALLLYAVIYIAWQTEPGARTVWNIVTALDGRLSGEYRAGTLARGLQLGNIVFQDVDKRINVDTVTTSWRWDFSPLKLSISNLAIGNVVLTQLPAPEEPLELPQSLRLPLALSLDRATLQQLTIRSETATQTYADIALHGSSDGINHRIQLDKAQTPAGLAAMQMYLAGDRPFKLSGKVSLRNEYRAQTYEVSAYFSGILEKMMVTANLSGGPLNGQADIIATLFSPIPFTNARIRISELNLAAFNDSAPNTRLGMAADLHPVQKTMPENIADLQVAGSISLTNRNPGPMDKNLLPIRSLSAEARLDRHSQQLTELTIRLPDQGVLTGSAVNRNPLKGTLSLKAQHLNLATLHGAMQPTRLSGPLTVEFEDNRQQVKLALAGDDYSISADADIDPLRFQLNSAELKSGDSRLTLKGNMTRDERLAYAIEGGLSAFNPALFIQTMQIAAPQPKDELPFKVYEANINGGFKASGQVQPQLAANISFEIRDSTYNNLPMHGGGALNMAGKQVHNSNAELTIAGNHIQVSGAFGRPSDRLLVSLDAPELGRLGFGLDGLLQLQGSFAGTTAKPQIAAEFTARNLRFAEHSLAGATGEIEMLGVPADNSDAKLKLDIRAQGYRGELAQLERLNAQVDGSYRSHTMRLSTAGRVRDLTVDLDVGAQGRLQELQQGLAWSGRVTQFDNRTVPTIHLANAASLEVAPERVRLGQADIVITGSSVALSHATYEAGAISSAGKADALEVANLLKLRKELTGEGTPFQTNLVLDAGWDFRLAQQAEGFVQIARRSGDITTQAKSGEIALGLSQLQLRGDFSGHQLDLRATAAASRIGDLQGSSRIGLLAPEGMLTITSDSPIEGEVALDIPQLQKIAVLAGPRISVNGEIKADFQLGGTVGSTQLSGQINGRQLALTLYDQGVRLSNGIARILLKDNVLEMQQVEFRGGEGTLRITGNIPISDQLASRPDLAANIVADRLQLLADPAAQLTLSGSGRISSTGEHYAVNGKFTVDQARFDLPETAAPQLGNDVVVIRDSAAVTDVPGKPLAEQRASPWSPAIHLDINLGRRFYFVGRGADLRLAGDVAITSQPGQQPQARGTVRVAEGTFEAFGAELAIERGIINFQGAMNNPNINILAMRRNQEVAAGVQVTGTANSPRVTLVSEPDVPQDQKLSWLVFGHAGGGEGQGAAQAAARGAANALANQLLEGGNLADRLGLDEVSFDTGTSGEQLVTLGKTITDKLTLGYRQGITGAESAVELTYLLSRHWSVVARGGQILGLNILYSNRFDRLGERRPRRARDNE